METETQDYIAGASGATLGFITGAPAGLGGSLGGAWIGGHLGFGASKLSRKVFNEMKRKRTNSVSSGTARRFAGLPRAASRKRVAFKRLSMRKSSYKKPRKVNMKKLRSKAKKVIKNVVQKTLECDLPVGTYHRDYVQEMNWTQIAANTQLVFGAGTRLSFNISPYTTKALEFTAFSSLKLIDAVSVVYNNKAKALNYENLIGNFGTTAGAYTAEIKKLKVSYTYCSYEVQYTNHTPWPYEVKVLIGKCKMDSATGMATAWENGIDSLPWRQGGANRNTINMGVGGLKPLHNNWDVKVKHTLLKPGESRTIKLYFKGCVDYNKHSVGTDIAPPEYLKGITQSILFVAKPMSAIQGFEVEGPHPSPPPLTAAQTMGVVGITTGNSLQKAITCEVREIYKFLQPANTPDSEEGNGLVWLRDYPAFDTANGNELVAAYTNKKNQYSYITPA